ncbi:hypothetical protein L198_00053 [Cryptococcus wingfieldii CBS 7118]|uniref:UBC core domain-containing protein n=1 Tax=Cryptococcus wingfieldii CBS 7118 TaxID=1295528 RepID=A0A1E3K5G3_9TREE|nr:hypothetical protein L198_00053 [Cryptococcus wingfieldii CBS 7118]ODO08329.1 hypothetical protein L198_00053 [Cryptococcus wingfieldii CBS 7118]
MVFSDEDVWEVPDDSDDDYFEIQEAIIASMEPPSPTTTNHTRTKTNAAGAGAARIPRGQSPQSLQELVQASQKSTGTRKIKGRAVWEAEVADMISSWVGIHEIEGYAGMRGTVQALREGSQPNTMSFNLQFEDIEGEEHELQLEMNFRDLDTYPMSYTVNIKSTQKLPRRAQRTFNRFTDIYGLSVPTLFQKLLASLQGDDEATGGDPDDVSDMEDEDDEDEDSVDDPWVDEVEKPVEQGEEVPAEWTSLRKHFEQAKSWGYRPGLTRVSDYWVISYSIPLKNISIDPNILATWDDSLVEAWEDDQRFVLLMGVDNYPPKPESMKFWMGFHHDYKPSRQLVIDTTRGSGLPPFFLSSSLLEHIKGFHRVFNLQVNYNLGWEEANRQGLDEQVYYNYISTNVIPRPDSRGSRGKRKHKSERADDPVARGFSDNIPLCAFYWVLKRFADSPKFCMNCGSEVEAVSVRPYVCSKTLCLYGFMSLGFGPSIDHTIITQPGVVDLLLSFAHSAASSDTRMALPTHLHIIVPADCPYNTKKEAILLDDMSDEIVQRRSVAWLIEMLPRVSHIKAFLESGGKLKDIECPSGAIGVLRWVVGTCRAYLKETKEGEGVMNDHSQIDNRYNLPGTTTEGSVRQFTFVVGDPEQEVKFKQEIQTAQGQNPNCRTYPTILAFHGSASERWHNILRTGLDYVEVANARAYGQGVYFANEASVSIGWYSRVSVNRPRANADFLVSKATALVELVNVPETFVSRNPYYVVNNLRQIKPFLLIVHGALNPQLVEEAESGEADDTTLAGVTIADAQGQNTVPVVTAPAAPGAATTAASGTRSKIAGMFGTGEKKRKTLKPTTFQHDPKVAVTWRSQPLTLQMPAKFAPTPLYDTQPDDELDANIINPPLPKPVDHYVPTLEARLPNFQLMPPPTETSIVASKALGKEFKACIKAQGEGALPFHVDPDNDSMYCWLLELHEFPDDSHLWKDMKKYGITSVVAEIRFPAAYPHSPPFMRVVHPRFLPFTRGGGGNITGGGSICNEILTATGWNPAFSVEAIIRDVMVNMTEATPSAKLDPQHWNIPYGMQESISAYKRGWEVPSGFDKLAL